ncbi:MAG: hypothetical protein IH969_06585, partial [Candidatus Krumholzibacteriota bacterium]|nr:hypothetical protein [Candidatus Krumholzibacteriota bacterium]
MDSSKSLAFSYLASLYRRQDQIDSVIWAYENLTRIKPDNYRLWAELGKLYSQIDMVDKSRLALRKSVDLVGDASNIMSFMRLGELYERADQLDSALISYRRGHDAAPEDLLVNRVLATLYMRVDSADQALPYARKVVELSPQDKPAIRRLGSTYYAADSLSQSDSVFSFLVSIGDRHPVNYFYIGRIAVLNEEYERARDNFITLTKLADTL